MFETIVDLIGHTSTATGLRVRAKLDYRLNESDPGHSGRRCHGHHFISYIALAIGRPNGRHSPAWRSLRSISGASVASPC